MRTITMILLLAACGPAATAGPRQAERGGETTVYVARHAERVSDAANADLSRHGLERAAALRELTRNAGLAAVWVTDFCRTAQTADPAASALGLPLRVAPTGSRAGGLEGCTPALAAPLLPLAEPTPPAALGRLILDDWRGRAVLVVGHSNTVPAIVEALGAPSLCGTLLPRADEGCELAHDAYGDVFIVRVPAAGTPTVEHRRLAGD